MKDIFKLGALAAAAVLACAPLSPAAAAGAAPAKAERVDTQPGKTINKLADEYYDAVARFEPVYRWWFSITRRSAVSSSESASGSRSTIAALQRLANSPSTSRT